MTRGGGGGTKVKRGGGGGGGGGANLHKNRLALSSFEIPSGY